VPRPAAVSAIATAAQHHTAAGVGLLREANQRCLTRSWPSRPYQLPASQHGQIFAFPMAEKRSMAVPADSSVPLPLAARSGAPCSSAQGPLSSMPRVAAELYPRGQFLATGAELGDRRRAQGHGTQPNDRGGRGVGKVVIPHENPHLTGALETSRPLPFPFARGRHLCNPLCRIMPRPAGRSRDP
jgi:hypothetical protein